jgi:hypothetical protein
MTDIGMHSRSPEDSRPFIDRAASARSAAGAAAERYVQERRRCRLTLESSRELLAMTQERREQLREAIASYAAALRREHVLPERVIVLVKSAVLESDSIRDHDLREMVEESVRWAVDAYYAT